MQVLETIDDVILACGGSGVLVRTFRVSRTSIFNWREKGRFPGETYFWMRDELHFHGYTAPDHLWGPMLAHPRFVSPLALADDRVPRRISVPIEPLEIQRKIAP